MTAPRTPEPAEVAEHVADGLRRYVDAGAFGCPCMAPAVQRAGRVVQVSLGRGEPGFLEVTGGRVRVAFRRRPDAYSFRWRDSLREVLEEIVPEGVEVK